MPQSDCRIGCGQHTAHEGFHAVLVTARRTPHFARFQRDGIVGVHASADRIKPDLTAVMRFAFLRLRFS